MRLAWVAIFLGVFLTLAPPSARAASWGEVFAADSQKFVFFGADGTLMRAPFNLATRETLWIPTQGQHLVRVRVSPDGERVAWLTRAFDGDTTRLWVDGPDGAVLRVRYFGLQPDHYGRVHSEPGVPSTEDPEALGARLVQPGPLMRRLEANTLEWTPDSRAVVFGYNDGIAAVPANGGSGFAVTKALAVRLDALEPAPIYLVDAIVLRKHTRYFNPTTPTDLADTDIPLEEDDILPGQPALNALELAHPDVMITKIATGGSYLLYPMPHRWRVFGASGLSTSRIRAASAGTIWWAAGDIVRAIRTADPNPTVEVRAPGSVVWLHYDETQRALLWAGGREVGRKAEDGPASTAVMRTGSNVRAGIESQQGNLIGLVTSDSLLVWDIGDDRVQRVALGGFKPSDLFQGPAGQVVVGGQSARGLPQLARADFEQGRLRELETPVVKGGVFCGAGDGAWVLLYDPGIRPPDNLQAFDVRAEHWTDLENPGLAGWEPLEPR